MSTFQLLDVACFNLNLLECKCVFDVTNNAFSIVLISTYWNVNVVNAQSVIAPPPVLISTYWNVNALPAAIVLYPSGFNLNLLECKLGQYTGLNDKNGF